MRRHLLAAAINAALASAAWGQAPPPGTYQFISGAGVGGPTFTVSGFSTNLGGSVTGADACAGLHIHGMFNGFGDPGVACGHGIIQMLVAPPPVSGGGLPGGMPTNVAGQLALTARPGVQVDLDILRGAALSGFALPSEGIAMALHLFDGRSDVQSVNFTGGVVGTTVMDLGRPAGSDAAPGKVLQTTLANPAQRVLSSPAATSWLEEFAILDDRSAESHRRDADKTKQQADEYRKLADDARRNDERNRRRAEDARKDGRDKDAKGWDEEAERDRVEAERREREGQRLDDRSEEQRQREAESRQRAQERRDDAERARERARQAERDRAERVRQAAEEKARLLQEARDERLRQERAERDKRIQDQQDKARAREAEAARQRARAEREHRQWLAEQEAQRNARARGSSSDADLAAAAARTAAEKKKKEEEEKTWADYVIGVFEGKDETPEEKLLQKIKEKLEEKLKEQALKHTGLDKIKDQLSERIANNIDELGLDAATGKLGEGIETLKKIKEIGDWMNSEMDKMAARQQRQSNKIDAILDPRNTEVLRGAGSGTIAGRDVIEVYKGAVEILKPSGT